MGVDLDKLNFYSGVNYMKRLISDSQSVESSRIDYNHGLGYVPQFVYYADLFNDGMLWYGGEGTESTSGGSVANPEIVAWARENTLSFYPYNYTGSRTVYFVIYRDYGEEQ